VLQVMMLIWCTVTLAWTEAPLDVALEKWDWAFKSILFAAFVPLVIRSRVQIEAFAQTYVFSLAANFVPFGIKTLISGGGYGTNLGLAQGNSGLSEGGLLSTICLMAVPLALFLGKNSLLMPRLKLMPLAYWGISALAVVTAIGTYERSALVGLVVLAIYMWWRSRQKFLFGVIGLAVAAGLIYATSANWNARIATIGEYQSEGSALTRLLVWKWTLNFSFTHPLGGGFMSYLVNHIEFPPDAGHPGGFTVFGRAFHSIYFEMLGEQGWPGLVMFLLVAASSMWSLRKLSNRTRKIPELEWVASMADALQSGLAVFMTSGAFVGIAFQPMFWYFISMSISLRAYVYRCERQTAAPATGWRGVAAQATSGQTNLPDWRERPVLPTTPAPQPVRGRVR
jgi:putative inorganic carbon (hco3(-)) transporter